MSTNRLGALDGFKSYITTALYDEGKSNAFIGRVAMKAISTGQNLDETKFLKNARRIANELDQNARAPMKVLFPIWGGEKLLTGNRRWGEITLSFNVSQDSKFARLALQERSNQVKERNQGTVLEKNSFSDLPLAVCTVQAIDAFDAFELAEIAISKELGLYSLLESRGRNIISSVPNQEPICLVLLAPHMTVHKKTGELEQDVFWFNSWPDKKKEPNRTLADIEKFRKGIDKMRKGIRKLPWRNLAEDVLARHYQAFSQNDLEAAFLDGWRLLEAIGGHQYEKSEKLVSRAAWFFEDPVERKQIGLHLMHRRNLISHGRPITANDNEHLAFQMKEFLSPMLHGFLINPFNFKNLQEFWQFCDLPVDQDARRRSLHVLNSSEKFRN